MFDTITEACEFTDINEMLFEDMMESKEFIDFCEYLEKVNEEFFIDPVDMVYDESYTSRNARMRGPFKSARKILHNTADTTKQVSSAYGKITDSSGNLLKTSFDLVMKLLNVGVKGLTFVLDKLTLVPKTLLGIIHKSQAINSTIRSKIRGNLSLYIQVEDLKWLYDHDLVHKIQEFFRISGNLVKGEAWKNLMDPNAEEDIGSKFTKADIINCGKMIKIYEDIKSIQFQPVIVNMNSETTRNLYFGTDKFEIGKEGKSYTYLEGLQLIMDDLNALKEPMNLLLKDLTKKVDQSKSSNIERINNTKSTRGKSWEKLSGSKVLLINRTIQSTAKMSTLISSLVAYVMKDIKTIKDAMDTINKQAQSK